MATLANYELLKQIAKGGMAEIWVARTRGPGSSRLCVVKRLLPQHASNEEYIRMFLDEGRIGRALSHPNVVQIFDCGSEGGGHYMAMEYLHGEDLRMILRALRAENRTIPLPEVLTIIASACAGLHHAHEACGPDGAPLGIVHRDVSPHNVFVSFDGVVKVVDFGIAKSEDRRWETKHGTIKGKIPYMSPEQIKGKRVDRRADLYALGVLLYELVLGRRPYVLSAGGDFAMMMAIARHDVRAPSQIIPDIDPALEQIIMRAMAYEPKNRYNDAREMQSDLAELARRQARPDIASFMATLFPSRVREWRSAQAQDGTLAAHVLQIEGERAQGAELEDDDSVDTATKALIRAPSIAPAPHAPPPNAVGGVMSASPAVADVVELLGMTILTFRGRIDEKFDGAELAGTLTGTVLFDLKGVERITSFGVREWFEMIRALDDGVEIWLARCSEALVTQMSLMKDFVGPAKIVSFDAPFLCDDCGNTFARTLDCENDAAILRGQELANASCPRCGGAAKLDDDHTYLAFAAPYAGITVPERTRTLLSALEDRDRSLLDAVDKRVNETETRIRVQCEIDGSFRWARVLDGVEGNLVIDFHGAPRVTPEGAQGLVRGLRALGSDLTMCEVIEAPSSAVPALGREPSILRVASVAFGGRCAECNASRRSVVGRRELEAAFNEHRAPSSPCRRCSGPLELVGIEAVQRAFFTNLPISTESTATAPSRSAAPAPAAKRAAATWKLKAAVAVAATATALLVLLAVGFLRARTPAAGTSTLSSAKDPSHELTEDVAIERRADGIHVRVTTNASSEAAAMTQSRDIAIQVFVAEVEALLPPDVASANASLPRVTDAAIVAARYRKQTGALTVGESENVVSKHREGLTILTASYWFKSDLLTTAQTYYAATRTFMGLTLAPVLPSRGEGLVVVDVSAPELHHVERGALLVRLDDKPAATLDEVSARLRSSSPSRAVFSMRGEDVTAHLSP